MWASGLLLGLSVAFAILQVACGEPRTRVVLITLDTLRFDAFSREGGLPPLERTRAWAERGLVFERHYSATGETQPSHATLFTGLHPWRHGLTLNSASLAEEHETLAERLASAGFRTAAAVASHPLESRYGFGQGFDVFVEDFTEGVPNAGRGYSLADSVTDDAFRLLDELGGDKQFFWFHYFDAHAPYGDQALSRAETLRPMQMLTAVSEEGADPVEVVGRARRLYEDDVRVMDEHLDALLRRLDRDAATIETHVVVVADHGENFGETGSLGHGKRLTSLVLHVPLFILSPEVEPGSRAEPVGMVDVPATILALAGVDKDLGSSESLLEPSRRQVIGMRRVFIEPFREVRLDGSVHTIEGLRFFAVDEDRLYMGNSQEIVLDSLDPRRPDAARIAELQALFRGFEDEIVDPNLGTLDAETIETMRALGYVQ